jgi:hypothetical protein
MATFKATILRHDLEYEAVVSVDKKEDIREMLNLSNKKLNKWKSTKNPIEVKASNKSPGKIMARPCFIDDNYNCDSFVEIDNNFTI